MTAPRKRGRRHYDWISNGAPDTEASVAERRYYDDVIRPQIDIERSARYPRITADNAREMIEWQERRIAELRATRGSQ